MSKEIHRQILPLFSRPIFIIKGYTLNEEEMAAVQKERNICKLFRSMIKHCKNRMTCMHPPGIKPGLHRWQRCILPLDHGCDN